MLKLVLAATFLVVAGPVAAATAAPPLPAIASVTGVAGDDVLNIRAAPDADSAILSTLRPDATGVEIVGFDPSGQWARIGLGEVSGWASVRFLRVEEDTWQAGHLPERLICTGTEPFWSLRHTRGKMEFATPGSSQPLDLRAVLDRGIAADITRALIAGEGEARVTAVIRPESCSDGMSDRAFGLSATLITEGPGAAPGMLTGCCSVAAR